MLTDKEIQEKYIAWRSNPENDFFDDCIFVTDDSVRISIFKLRELKIPEVCAKIAFIRSRVIVKCPECNKEISVFISIRK